MCYHYTNTADQAVPRIRTWPVFFTERFNKIAEKNLNGQTICYIVDFISLLFYNLTTPWQLYCRTARYHLRLRGVRNNKIKQDTFFDGPGAHCSTIERSTQKRGVGIEPTCR